MGRDMATRKRSRNSNSSSTSAMRRTPSLSELPRTTRAARGDSAAPSPMEGYSEMQRRHSMEFIPMTETAAFLKVCGFCRRGIGPGRDTFIYMGEAAFCSHECREQKMTLDEMMETKCPDQSGKGSTIAAA